ncbi:MAG: copper amine oxidase N-terminal domain-containing protein [Candidatus Eremiobacteraeota bacterium]|nr:copper amine oxidase N-terminal domain-containing protein [Candidatus Eremiobacteraeota bacterium]MBC5827252.1 copper amine oxidase N-terminal domain-containing protein [Candidatus Eremiobacteraeota bacterium]
MKFSHRLFIAALSAAITSALAAVSAQPALSAGVTVIVNGNQVQFDQPPVERAGRVFVPLRGVFEKLGASVVYDNGTINATGNGRAISLKIGSTAASVNGSAKTIDVAPFLIGSRTLVPLRFISQALGANVDYNNGSNTVNVSLGGGGAAAPTSAVSLTDLKPGSDAVVAAQSPSVSGSFSEPVDPNGVKITLDGRDVSSTTAISPNNFLFSPSYPLTADKHVVRVTGKSAGGTSFDRSWSFTSGTSIVKNYINVLTPAKGATVGSSFTITGTTLPNSKVHIVAIPSYVLGGIFPVTAGTYTADLTADAGGRFSQQVSVNTASGGNVAVRITSTAPTTAAGATMTLELKS